ncbi:M56 family metallopeptidase [Flavobacterium branchiicola]|uniref:M56 family metallopeptidase n=1 Tax=Flavobacterium branchiicola TaxID=1114875 RepID=A0ABV9PE66_9FLAO|nr:M56 family metallopeptidase [Flavobacterium branchiicola]MBS7253756.1 M56 family peptidase [Flavobacterium branchiicola]
MEALLIYIAKSAGLVILFYCAYYFLLRKETFFNSNRWFLLIGLITSVVLPFAVYTKIIWVKPTPETNINLAEISSLQNIQTNNTEINWWFLLLLIYSIGFILLLIKLGMDFYSLHNVLKGQKIQQQADFKFVDIKDNIAPFSYFDYIVYNSSMYTALELENIIEHEKVHSDQNHTVDVLISRVFCLLFWFNPVVWLYKKAISQNLEFIADKEASKKIADKKAYQYTLLKITTHESCVAITNHFYQSLIKKRIVMLNKNQSKKRSTWKYYMVIPALVAFVLLFQIEVIAKEKKEAHIEVSKIKTKSVELFKINKTTTDEELKVIAEKLKQNHNVDFTIAELKRNSQNEVIALKVHAKIGTEQEQEYEVLGDKGIKDCGIMITTNDDGSKKISLVAGNQAGNPNDKVNNVEIIKVQNSKTNVNTNSNTSTKTDCTVSTVTNTVVSTDANGNVNTNVTVTNNDGQQTKITNSFPLYVVNGMVIGHIDPENANSLNSLNIKTMTILKNIDAVAKYGEDAVNGVIIIDTKK